MNCQKEEQQNSLGELYCLCPRVGEERLSEYMTGTLPETEKLEFEHHLSYCMKCHHEVRYLRWALRQIPHHTANLPKSPPDSLRVNKFFPKNCCGGCDV